MYYITETHFSGITAKNARLQNEEQPHYCPKLKGNCHSLKFVVTKETLLCFSLEQLECM